MRRRILTLAILAGCTYGSRDTGSTPGAAETTSARPPQALSIAKAPPAPTASASAAPVKPPVSCPADMVAVDGLYCEELEQKCLERRKPWQCKTFEEPSKCAGAERAMTYCIDRYEYPNREGELADVMKSWRDAQAACAAIGKRLCTETEWTLACEGPERLPFPYGYTRDAQVCSIDKHSPKVDEGRLFSGRTQAAEVARLDQREPSGSREKCVSAYGVRDLTGNVDEWVVNESGRPYQSSLKGGNWGEYRNACRPATRGHGEGFFYYQIGFRCCRDPG